MSGTGDVSELSQAKDSQVLAEAFRNRVDELEDALRYYAERRNWPEADKRDAYDGRGPGARARTALVGGGRGV